MRFVRENKIIVVVALLVVVNVIVCVALYGNHAGNLLTVSFLDVGQGDAIFITAPNGSQLLIDAGPNRAVFAPLARVMPFYDRSIDAIIATHPDADHIGGFPELLRRYDVAMIIESGATSDTGTFAALESEAEKEGAERVIARRGMRMWLDKEARVYIDILYPDRDPTGLETNDASIFTRLVYGQSKFMLTGDAPQKIESYVVALGGESLHADVLKAGHHGSKTSSAQIFLEAVDPSIVVISAGRDNRYGHPHKEVTDRFAALAIQAVSTADEGTITFLSDGETVWREQ